MVSQGFFSGSADRKKRMAGSSDTKVALGGDNLGSFGGVGAILGVGALGIKGIQSAVEGGNRLRENIQRRINPEEDDKQSFFSPRVQEQKVALKESNFDNDDFQNYMKALGIKRPKQLPGTMIRMLKENYMDDKRDLRYKDGQLFNKAPEQNIFTKTGNFLANLVTPPAVAGTLEGKPTRFAGEADPTPRPKLDYVNPDKTTMTGSEIRDAFRPSNLFGYKDKFGRYGEAVDRDRQQTINRVSERYSSMPDPDARSLSQIRADRAEKMKKDAKDRQTAFKDTGVQTFGGKVQPQKSADVTYNTNMYSNPAYGFRSKMKPEDQKKYDASAKYATEAARPDPSIGNVLTSVGNIVKKVLPNTPFTRQASLESIGERQMRLAGIEVNRPTYQKEAFARNYLGISIGDIRARQRSIIEQNARARNEAFKAERAQKAAEKAAKRIGGNIGTGRDGGFGTGTSGQGVPSNPKGFSGYSRKSSPSSSSRSTSKSQGRGGSRGGSTGGSGSSSKGGTGSGGTKTSRTASKASRSRTGRSRTRCDVRTKIDIAPLTNPDLIRDDLANIAYFVKEIK